MIATAPSVSDWLTHIDTPEDVPYLRVPLLDVNMRLFRANPSYRSIVLACCEHIAKVCTTKMEGYSLPFGCSGANCAIPFNIIARHVNRGTAEAFAEVMINPRIVNSSGDTIGTSNCGSIRLASPIQVWRKAWVQVTWFDPEGVEHTEGFTPPQGSFTIQHEIDHNLGVLITDRERRVGA